MTQGPIQEGTETHPVLGIDIGRVLIMAGDQGGPDTSFLGGSTEAAIHTPPYPGMFEVVPDLVSAFAGRVWLVSKAFPKTQEKTRRWLAHHRFFERTGIPHCHLVFCLRREQKAQLCRDKGITHFIDDRMDVLGHMSAVVPHRFLFGPQATMILPEMGLVHTPTWRAVHLALSANSMRTLGIAVADGDQPSGR
jgi:hypothetical protein